MNFTYLAKLGLVIGAFALAAGAPLETYAKASATSKSKVITVASKSKSKSSKKKYKRSYIAPDNDAAVVVDADTGRVLYEKNAAAVRYPASLTKMMTLYLTFDALKKGKISINDELPVSAKAASQPATNIALDKGDRLPVEKAIESLVVRSANDSALVMAEALGKTEWNFALMMTQKARELGMKNTVFRNPNGLPDNKQHTTAYDMARLAIALRRDFPEYYPYFNLREFTYNGVTYTTHNHVLENYPGADGLKTGYIRASGFNVATSAKRDGFNLVAVVMGGNSASQRDNQMVDLLDRTFARMATQRESVAENQAKPEDESALYLHKGQEIALFGAR